MKKLPNFPHGDLHYEVNDSLELIITKESVDFIGTIPAWEGEYSSHCLTMQDLEFILEEFKKHAI